MFNVLFLGPGILVASSLVLLLFYQFSTRRFTANAVRAVATVIDNKRHQASKSSVFIPTLTFQDESGKAITLEATMTGAASLSAKKNKPGDKLVILYDKANPSKFITDDWFGRYIYTFRKAAALVLIIIIGGILLIIFS